ncbi:outer membrane beta-barrel protein [Shewanella gelidii]|uniref:Outer membrane beta-barrel protein n=1 Tax=Shewanella gelidii TaxID=1642821 RepID=A0A917JQT8_9GAMM|nr:outer membrane beta-barrel protein [Shewanella gelidii]MCL1099480.1 outer membrane beta-barrel protein [Shewanella gelidii]GGI77303.1 hypothetical protein GCM10009332_13310 [Shewanella gelidii]
MKNGITQSVIALSCLFAFNVSANEAGAIATSSGIDLVPRVDATLKHDDNLASSSNNEEQSWIMEVRPSIVAELEDGLNIYTAEFGIAAGHFFDSQDDDYLDARVSGSAYLEGDQSNRLNLDGLILFGHEDRGTGVSEGVGGEQEEPNTFVNLSIGGYYEYGALSTPARLRINAKYYDKEYTNFESVTKFKNYESYTLGTSLYYDTRASTSLVVDLIREDISYEYVDPTGDRDSVSSDVKVGVDWEATALTQGSARIGYQKKEFDNQLREDFGGLAWSINVTWSPLTYSSVDFNTGRKAKDPSTDGDYVQETTYGVTWSHEWSPLWASNVGVNLLKEDFTGISRKDEMKSFNLGLNYNASRWLTLKAGVDITDKSSSQAQIKYDKTVFYITAEMTL